MPPGGSKNFELKCSLLAAGGNRLELAAEATGDLTAAQSFVTQVEALADLKMFLNDTKGPLPVGEDAVYEIRLVNRGTKAAERVGAVVFFSEGLEAVSVEGARGSIERGQVAFEQLPRLAAGAEVVLKVVTRADRPGNHVFRAEVVCLDPETRLVTEETTRFYGEATTASRPAGSSSVPYRTADPSLPGYQGFNPRR